MLVKVITPLHVGTGRSTGDIDLEVARERATHWPVIPGSSVKGVLRDAVARSEKCNCKTDDEMKTDPTITALFGKSGKGENETQAGALCVSDLRLLLMPVRSFYGCFALVTCPLAIERFNELRAIAKLDPIVTPTSPGDRECYVGDAGTLCPPNTQKAYFEDIDLEVQQGDVAPLGKAILEALGADLQKRLAIVSDTLFCYYADIATEKTTKVTLEFERKSARTGGLRTEESVPPEAVFYGLAQYQPINGTDAKTAKAMMPDLEYLQFGGKSTTGQGLCHIEFVGGE